MWHKPYMSEAAMTSNEMRECLVAMDCGQRELARILRRDEARVRKMVRGTEPIPSELAVWLRLARRVIETAPLGKHGTLRPECQIALRTLLGS